jgi:hypothetical protein
MEILLPNQSHMKELYRLRIKFFEEREFFQFDTQRYTSEDSPENQGFAIFHAEPEIAL